MAAIVGLAAWSETGGPSPEVTLDPRTGAVVLATSTTAKPDTSGVTLTGRPDPAEVAEGRSWVYLDGDFELFSTRQAFSTSDGNVFAAATIVSRTEMDGRDDTFLDVGFIDGDNDDNFFRIPVAWPAEAKIGVPYSESDGDATVEYTFEHLELDDAGQVDAIHMLFVYRSGIYNVGGEVVYRSPTSNAKIEPVSRR